MKNENKQTSASTGDRAPRIREVGVTLAANDVASFFFVVNPGLEEVARREAVVLGFEPVAVDGGLQLDATWEQIRCAQSQLKIPSRVFVRVDQFGVRDFPKLFRKISGLPWKTWLREDVGISVRAVTHTSRLKIKKRIEETAEDAFAKAVGKRKVARELLCLVRIEHDLATVSLDLSGELLHKRGEREDVGTAPLRETWAAAMVQESLRHIGASNRSGRWHWIEPMAGTGVFLREALGLGGGAREYAVETCFNIGGSVTASVAATDSVAVSVFGKYFGTATLVDRSVAQLVRATAGLINSPGASGLATNFICGDWKTMDVAAHGESRLVILNPPWGKRLKGDDATGSKEAQDALLAALEEKLKPSFCAVVMPKLRGERPKRPRGWTEASTLSFRVGGVAVVAYFFTVARN